MSDILQLVDEAQKDPTYIAARGLSTSTTGWRKLWSSGYSVPFAVADGQDSRGDTGNCCWLSPGHPLPRTVQN